MYIELPKPKPILIVEMAGTENYHLVESVELLGDRSMSQTIFLNEISSYPYYSRFYLRA